MRSLILIEGPGAPVVSLPELKAHLRVDHTNDDATIEALERAATAHLDGWHGVLGRAIMPQEWAETFTCLGPYRLTLPDVVEVAVTADGAPMEGTVSVDALGALVSLPSEPSTAVIQYTCALPEHLLPAAQAAVKLYVEHLFEGVDLSPAFNSLVSVLRWRVV